MFSGNEKPSSNTGTNKFAELHGRTLQRKTELEEKVEAQEKKIAAQTEEINSLKKTLEEQTLENIATRTYLQMAKAGNKLKISITLALADSKAVNEKGETALHLSVQNNDPELSKIILQNDSDLFKCKDTQGLTSIQRAAQTGKIKLLEWFYQQGKILDFIQTQEAFDEIYDVASPDAKQFLADKRLLDSAKTGNLEEIKDALVKGGNINAKSPEGCTALYNAVFGKYEEVIQFLIEQGADPTLRNNPPHVETSTGHETPLHLAKTAEENNFVELMVDSFLVFAAEHGNEQDVKMALDLNANLMAKNNNGETALHKAVQFEHVDIIKILLKQYAEKRLEIDDPAISSTTPYQLALSSNFVVEKKDKKTLPLAAYMERKFGGYLKLAKKGMLFSPVEKGVGETSEATHTETKRLSV